MTMSEEIKRWVDSVVRCDECPNDHEVGCEQEEHTKDCWMCIETIAYIEQLEETIALMQIQMRGDCGCCKHKAETELCAGCVGKRERPNWEYEGLPEVNG